MTTGSLIRNEIRSLTSFRFFAAGYVFLFHLDIRTPDSGDSLLGAVIAEGAVGMTMFFVLSGFILMHAYDGLKFNVHEFFWNRIARVYPVYLLAAILALPWLFSDLSDEYRYSGIAYAIGVGVILVFSGVFLVQAWLPQTFAFWNNSASWSVSNEGFFYACFPILRETLKTLELRTLIILIFFLSLSSAAVPASAIVFRNAPESFSLFYALPFYRIPEFICGMIAYRLYKLVPVSRKVRLILIFVTLCGFLHVVMLAELLPGYTLHNWILIPAICGVLVLLADLETSRRGMFVGGLFVWLGRISYCFYSFQFHVLEGVRQLFPVESIGALSYGLMCAVILLLVSALIHHLFEEPCRALIRQSRLGRGAKGLHA